ncbi:MAG: DegT/DnrJ/EryC1/StrS family aminotransferase [Thermoplasmata archaeon]|nr:DegT/DnrJ/EryC1/StrS family aminotransferase [Thermoplasmata archaeon]
MTLRVRVGEFRVDDEIRSAVTRVLDSDGISEGRETKDFESAFSRFIGTKHAVAVNSGTSALVAGLLALKAKMYSEGQKPTKVITTPLTYVATANAIVLSGMEPVFADVDSETLCLDPERARAAIDDECEGDDCILLPVHLMGYVCDMDELNGIARGHGIRVFEDSSQAHGSLYKGKRAGSMSDLSSYSFYVAHNIQAGELGAVLTNDIDIARMVRKLKANGRMCDCLICTRGDGKCPRFGKEGQWDPRFLHDEIGYNFKTTEFSTAIANAQIARADDIAAKRGENFKLLNDLLEKHSDTLVLPKYSEDLSYLGYPIVIRDGKAIGREQLQLRLEEHGVETRPLFGCIPIHQPAYKQMKSKYENRLPNARRLGSQGLYIGCHQYLTKEDLLFVSEAFDASLE